ncbi:hypothetical protein Hc94105_0101 [Helicobacter cinaedi]|nr:hypothetical protein Hc94105_0101 [Helicobacter cinaedi]
MKYKRFFKAFMFAFLISFAISCVYFIFHRIHTI